MNKEPIMKTYDNVYEEIINLIKEENDLHVLSERLNKYHPYDIAQVLAELNKDEFAKITKIYSDEELADILSYTDTEDASDLLEDMEEEKAASIIEEMETDDAADVLQEMEEEKAISIISLLEDVKKEDLKELSEYDLDQAGSIMNSHFLQVLQKSDVKLAMKLVVKNAPDVETINTIFVVDEADHLLGTVNLKDLIIARSPLDVDEIMQINFKYCETTDTIDEVVKKIRDYDILALPVLEDGVLKGIITMDDAIDALTDVVEEDYAKLAGLSTGEEQEETVHESVKKRLPWLAILLVLDVIVSLVIAQFQHVIDSLTVLAFFQASILGLAGNCGTQSLAIAVRRIGADEMNTSKAIFVHLGRESLLGLATGITLGSLAFVCSSLMLMLTKIDITPITSVWQIGFVIGVAITIAVTCANIFGTLIPIIFFKCHIDPAVASGPFITTLNDILSIVIYFTIASVVLINYL